MAVQRDYQSSVVQEKVQKLKVVWSDEAVLIVLVDLANACVEYKKIPLVLWGSLLWRGLDPLVP